MQAHFIRQHVGAAGAVVPRRHHGGHLCTRIKYEKLEKLRENNFVAINHQSCINSHKQDIGGTFTVRSTSVNTNHHN